MNTMRQVVYNVLIEIGIETKATSSHCKRNRENEVNETKAEHTKSRHRRRARQRSLATKKLARNLSHPINFIELVLLFMWVIVNV